MPQKKKCAEHPPETGELFPATDSPGPVPHSCPRHGAVIRSNSCWPKGIRGPCRPISKSPEGICCKLSCCRCCGAAVAHSRTNVHVVVCLRGQPVGDQRLQVSMGKKVCSCNDAKSCGCCRRLVGGFRGNCSHHYVLIACFTVL